ncbi:MAG: hypothetical protein Q4D98_02850 [Planctomycetia bacterium]|nr:hypothetical protein [Planctomycetia bacterium]
MRYLKISEIPEKEPAWWNLIGWKLRNYRASRHFREILKNRSAEKIAAEWDTLGVPPEIWREIHKIARQNGVFREKETLFSPHDELAVVLGNWIHRVADSLETEGFLYDCSRQLEREIPWSDLPFPLHLTLGEWACYLQNLPHAAPQPRPTPWGCYGLLVLFFIPIFAAGLYAWRSCTFFDALRFAGLLLLIEGTLVYLGVILRSFWCSVKR